MSERSDAFDASFADAAPGYDVPLPPEPSPDAVFPVPNTQGGERGTVRERAAERGARLFGDVAGLLAGELPEPPRPEVLTRGDGRAIFYTGQVNALFADAESGKTMVTCAAIQEVLKVGGRAVFVDIDHNGIAGIVTRLLDLGCTPEQLGDTERFRYVEPEDKAQLLDLVAFLRTWRPTLVVVDSVGELLPMFRLSSNSPDDFTTVHTEALKPLAVAGACVITVDHVAKNAASAESGPTGTNAKRRAVGGVSIRVKVKDQFVPGYGGAVWLMVNKDRHGGLREHCPRGEREPSAGLFTITPSGGGMTWNLRAPQDSDSQQIDGVSDVDLTALDQLDPAPTSVRDVKDRMSWRSDRATEALRVWRSRSRTVPGERGTPGAASVPRSRTPVLGTGNTPDPVPPAAPSPADQRDRSLNLQMSRTIPDEAAPVPDGTPAPEPARSCGHPGDPAKKCGACIAEKLARPPEQVCRASTDPADPKNPYGLCGRINTMHSDVERKVREMSGGAVA